MLSKEDGLMDINKASDMLKELDISFKYERLEVKVDFLTVYPFQPGEGFDFHSHSNYEFHYIKEGRGTVILHEKEYELHPGCFYLTGPGVLHKQYADKEFPMLEYALKCSIHNNNSKTNVLNRENTDELSYVLSLLNNEADRVIKDTNNLHLLFENVFREVYNRRPGYFSVIKNSVLNIIIFASRSYTDGTLLDYAVPTRDLDNHRFETLRNYIHDNISKNITRQELASYISLSIRQTDRIVRAQTGISIHSFIINERIASAKRLLQSTGFNLSVVAERTGFSSEYHLSSTFKKIVGLTPSEYRKAENQKLNK
jgi:AraC-like DNA-binding protein/quercetin dioxygenase-like cupin family protein